MLRAGYSVETLADAAGVVSKSVQRWVTGEVTPFGRTRFRVAALLGEDEGYLWPQAVNHAALAGAELAASYPRRTDVPAHLWTDLLRATQRNIDVLAFAGLFLTEEHSGWLPALAGKAGTNARIRLLLGDLKECSVLTVGETEDFTSNGGIINFKLEDSRVRVEIDRGAAERAKLRISSKLLSLAHTLKR